MKKNKNNDSSGLYVKVYNNDIEKALKIFKRKVKESDLMIELKQKSFYEKPSDVRRRTINLAKLRQKYKTIEENKSLKEKKYH